MQRGLVNKMTNQEMIELYQKLYGFNDLKGVKFNYALSKNIALMKSEIDFVNKSFEVSSEYKKFDEERVKIVEEHAKKDANGEPIVENNNYKLGDTPEETRENTKKLNKALEPLKEKYKEVLDEREKQVEEFNALLKQPTDVEFYKIDVKHVPEEITTEQMRAIYPLLEDEE